MRLVLLSVAVLLAVPALRAQDPVIPLLSPTPRAPGHFGGQVAGISDLNGDGRGDLIVGADWEGGLAGRVHVFSGADGALIRSLVSPTPSTSPIGAFGIAVAAVPDTDGDTVADILVGSSAEGSSATGRGRVHLFSGATGTLLRTHISPNPEGAGQAFPSFGCSVAGVPDLNGDGRGDILVGACREDTGDAGRAYLISGATGTLLLSLSSPNPSTNGQFGQGVSGVPDADGDGLTDLLVSATTEEGGATDSGRAYLFSGATGVLLRTLVSPSPFTRGLLGRSAAGVPDANGDGRGDLLVGATGEGGTGQVYLFSGATGALIRAIPSPTPRTGGQFGLSLSAVADVDGDGVADHLVGAATEADGATSSGRAYLFSGATGALLRSLVSPTARASGFFGYSVSGVPDTDGDGRGDLLIGALQEDGPGSATGRAYLFPGAFGVAAEPSPERTALALTVAPHPMRTSGTVTLTLEAPEPVTVALFDVLGRRVQTLHEGPLSGGAHAFAVRADPLPPGLYLVRATAPGASSTRHLVIAR
jgi:hypothetical protein